MVQPLYPKYRFFIHICQDNEFKTGGDLQFLPVFFYLSAQKHCTHCVFVMLYTYTQFHYIMKLPHVSRKILFSAQNRTLHLSYWELYPHCTTDIHSCQAMPTLGIFGHDMRNGVRCAGSIGGVLPKGVAVFGSQFDTANFYRRKSAGLLQLPCLDLPRLNVRYGTLPGSGTRRCGAPPP